MIQSSSLRTVRRDLQAGRVQNWLTILPLPKREGRGEGEPRVRVFLTIVS